MNFRPAKKRWEWIPSWQMLLLLVPNFLLAGAVVNAPTLSGQALRPLQGIVVLLCASSALAVLWWGTRRTWRAAAPTSRWRHRLLQCVRLGILVPCVLFGIIQFTKNIRQIAAAPLYFNGSLGYLEPVEKQGLSGQRKHRGR